MHKKRRATQDLLTEHMSRVGMGTDGLFSIPLVEDEEQGDPAFKLHSNLKEDDPVSLILSRKRIRQLQSEGKLAETVIANTVASAVTSGVKQTYHSLPKQAKQPLKEIANSFGVGNSKDLQQTVKDVFAGEANLKERGKKVLNDLVEGKSISDLFSGVSNLLSRGKNR